MKKMKSFYAAVLIFVLGGPVLSLPDNSMCSNGPISSIDKKIVLVIDASATMNSQGKLEKVGSVLKEWIMNGISCSTQLGMVKFSWKSQTLSSLVDINEQSRVKLVEAIPKIGQGDSNVLNGLKKAIKVLDGGNNSRDSSVIVVITDANKTDFDFDDTFLSSMEASQVKVIVVVISDEMETLNAIEKLTKLTNGFARYIHNEDIYKSLTEVLTVVETQGLDNVSLSLTTAKSAISNDTSILSVSTTHASNENSEETSFSPVDDTTAISHISNDNITVSASTTIMSTLEDNVTAITQSVDLTTSALDVISSTEPSGTTFALNDTTIYVAPTSTITPALEAAPQFLYLGAGIVVMIIVASVIVLSILYCRKQKNRPLASHGFYAPMDVRMRPVRPIIHGDQVINHYAHRPNSSYS